MRLPPVSVAALGRSLSTSHTQSGPSTVSSMPISELSAAGISRAPAMKSRKPTANCPMPKNAEQGQIASRGRERLRHGQRDQPGERGGQRRRGVIWTSGCRRMSTVATAKLTAMTIASRSPPARLGGTSWRP